MRSPGDSLDVDASAALATHTSRSVLELDAQPAQAHMTPAARVQAVVAWTDPLALRAARTSAAWLHAHDHRPLLETNSFNDETTDADEPMQHCGDAHGDPSWAGRCDEPRLHHRPRAFPASGSIDFQRRRSRLLLHPDLTRIQRRNRQIIPVNHPQNVEESRSIA